MYLIEDVFLKNGVDFVSMTESLDTSTPLGLAMIGILSVFAQLERSNIKSRMMMGRDARVKSGKWHGNANDIIGYRYNKAEQLVTQEPYEASVIRSIFNMYLDGMTESGIAKKLSEMQFRGHYWTAGKIQRIIHQPLYIGLQRWRGETYRVEGLEPIISDEVWERTQREASRRSSALQDRPERAGIHATLLGGILWCGCCGKRCNGIPHNSRGNRYYRYMCYNQYYRQHKNMKHDECSNVSVTAHKLDDAVIEQIKALRFNSDGHTGAFGNDGMSEYRQRRDAAEKRLEDIEKQKSRLVDLYALGTVSFADISKRIDSLTAEQENIREQLKELESPSGVISAEEAKTLLNHFCEVVETATFEEKYKLIHQLIQSVSFDHDQVSIRWNFSLD